MSSPGWRKSTRVALDAAVEGQLRDMGFVRARRLPGTAATVLARWVGQTWQSLSLQTGSVSVTGLLKVAHLPVALLWVRLLKASGVGDPADGPRSSIVCWLSKVHSGPHRGAPRIGAVPFSWTFDETMDVAHTANDIASTFRVAALPLFQETLTPEAARTRHAHHTGLVGTYEEHPELAAYLGDWDVVRRWPHGPLNPAWAHVFNEWAAKGLPDTSGDVPCLALGASLDGVPNPFPPAPARGKRKNR